MAEKTGKKKTVDKIGQAVATARVAKVADPEIMGPVADGAPPIPAPGGNYYTDLNENNDQDVPRRYPDPALPGLPTNYPVQLLGKSGIIHFYLDSCNQLIPMKPPDHTDRGIANLFGQYAELMQKQWPKYKKVNDDYEEIPGVWDPKAASHDLIAMQGQVGIFDPGKNLVGRGAWRDDDGELIYHLGNYLLKPTMEEGHDKLCLGKRGDKVYAGGSKMVPPKALIEGAGVELQDMLSKWYFVDDYGLMFLAGWIMVAPFSGVLDWRPLIWLTGDSGTGKSSLQQLVETIITDMISVADTTAAGLWQKLGIDALPVGVDELEAEEDNSRSKEIIKLARKAASGSMMLRGGQDHNGFSFEARSCFLFSSILPPPMDSQDYNRIGFVDLKKIPKGTESPDFNRARLRQVGQSLRARFLDYWPKWDRTVEIFRRVLIDLGHDNRGADVFGTLMAGHWAAIHDSPPDSARAAHQVETLTPAKLSESTDREGEGEACLNFLMSSQSNVHKSGGVLTMGQLILRGIEDPELNNSAWHGDLGFHGLKMIGREDDGRVFELYVANKHEGLARIMKDSRWNGGGWKRALLKLPGARRDDQARYYAGANARGIILPMELFLEDKADKKK